MGIRFQCPNGHKLNVKADLAGKRASCPECGAKLVIPAATTNPAAGPRSGIAVDPAAVVPVSAAPQPIPSEKFAVPVFTEPLDTASLDSLPTDAISIPPSALAAMQNTFQRRRTQKMQLMLAIVMLLAVIVLAGVLVWVIRKNGNASTETTNRNDALRATVSLASRTDKGGAT